ncbi:CmcJ/NvfI family oxidoreductase [Sphingosinicella terrae]|uniref:CmcJ/NvfI family oxidoreductase n=1 Tax=Sphingosinicella terrae TaxID=2172047 RepID=UPI002547452D|nr:CmcJ/NvfI family oxidoreductase [Sphingosinicella terrae]
MGRIDAITSAINAVETRIGYLVPTSRVNRRFWAPGAELNTGIYESYPVTVRNARTAPEPFTLDRHGFCLSTHRSGIADFHDAEAVNRLYPDEVAQVAKALTGCDLVVPMGAQIRSSGQTGPTVQPPAAEAHVDFTTKTARRIAQVLYERAVPGGPGFDRFICFSLWRTFSPPPQDWPLALCEYGSVGDEEGVPNTKVDVDVIPEGDALFAPIEGEEDMAAATIFRHNPAHLWWYFPDMVRDEIVFIKFHDSDHDRAWRAPHTAFHDTSRPGAHVRESLEFRAIAYFSRAG